MSASGTVPSAHKTTVVKHAGWLIAAILLAGCGASGSESTTAAVVPPDSGSPPATNQPPQITSSPQGKITLQVGDSFYEQAQASDAEGDKLTFSITNKPAWATFDASTGVLRGNPKSNDVGRYSDIVISVSDGPNTTTGGSFEVIVDASGSTTTNHAPTLSGTAPASVTAGSNYYFQPGASDSDGDPLSFSVQNLPAWASFNATNGAISGTPGAEHVGVTSGIQISVTDGTAITYGEVFEIEVTTEVLVPSNSAPTLGGTPPTSVVAGNSYFFRPTANDANGDALRFAVANLPGWAGFNSTDGTITGTPTSGQVGTYSNIRISVSDGIATTTGPAFSIEVVAGNRAPTLSGTPAASVNAGDTYRFQPTANDPDGDTLSFTIRNLPSWASFDANTGALIGTPTDGDVGTYENIAISASDGSLQTTGATFSIEVTQVSLGSTTLSWIAPTQNMDGSLLTDLAGYRLYYGTSEGNYTETISVDNPGIVTYVVDNLPANTYYFVATAYNSAGVESPFSGVAVRVVN